MGLLIGNSFTPLGSNQGTRRGGCAHLWRGGRDRQNRLKGDGAGGKGGEMPSVGFKKQKARNLINVWGQAGGSDVDSTRQCNPAQWQGLSCRSTHRLSDERGIGPFVWHAKRADS